MNSMRATVLPISRFLQLYQPTSFFKCSFSLEQWFSTSLMMWPFTTVPHVVLTPNIIFCCCFINVILLLLWMNCNVISVISDDFRPPLRKGYFTDVVVIHRFRTTEVESSPKGCKIVEVQARHVFQCQFSYMFFILVHNSVEFYWVYESLSLRYEQNNDSLYWYSDFSAWNIPIYYVI